jgi:hypothetical protein
MDLRSGEALFNVDRPVLTSSLDREPFGFTHRISGHELFELDQLGRLASLYDERDYFVASGAPEAATRFYAVRHSDCKPVQAIDRLAAGNQRVLLKRPENYDSRFRELLHTLFDEIARQRGGIGGKVVRLDGSILISSAATITPFHFDPEITFFFQVAGEKIYHVYSPKAVSESELEQFYVRNVLNVAQVSLAGRDPAHEHVFALAPGNGMHQPRHAPHWVETTGSITVSYTISFETDATRSLDLVRAFNFYERKLGLSPAAVGAKPNADRLKARTMDFVIPLRKRIGATLHRIRRQDH